MTINPYLGAGQSGLGNTQAGFGTPKKQLFSANRNFVTPTGSQGNARYIDPITKDYALDKFGNFVGMNAVPQMVQLALSTIKNSSAVVDFGFDFANIKIITTDTTSKVNDAVSLALADLINSGLISLTQVNVQRFSNTGIFVQVFFVDLTDDTEHVFTI